MALSFRRASGLSAAFALFLAVSLGAKFAFTNYGVADKARLERDLVRQLAGQGFLPAPAPRKVEYWPISVSRGACHLLVANGDDATWLLDQRRAEASPAPVLIGYRGRWSVSSVVARPEIEYLLQQYAYALGIKAARPAVIAIAASNGCPAPGTFLDGLQAWIRGVP